MTLQEQLNAFREQFQATVPEEDLQIMHRATQDIRNSGILENALNVGDSIPGFSLNNSEGQSVRVQDLLAGGPLILTFYRGKW